MIVSERQKLMADQIKLRRKQKKVKESKDMRNSQVSALHLSIMAINYINFRHLYRMESSGIICRRISNLQYEIFGDIYVCTWLKYDAVLNIFIKSFLQYHLTQLQVALRSFVIHIYVTNHWWFLFCLCVLQISVWTYYAQYLKYLHKSHFFSMQQGLCLTK
jgi:hypothetical protein